MPLIATLPMYDWPERRKVTDARWASLRDALLSQGFSAPAALTRDGALSDLWLSPDLLIGETCSHPLATALNGKVRYVATPVHDVAGCGQGTYRSAIVRRGLGTDVPVPDTPAPSISLSAISGRFASNEAGSMSGFVALGRDLGAVKPGAMSECEILWTGSHRASISAVAEGRADYAAIDCVTWAIARIHEPASTALHVAGWTASRPALPLIASLAFDDEALSRIRTAVLASMDSVVLDDPFEISPLPDRQP